MRNMTQDVMFMCYTEEEVIIMAESRLFQMVYLLLQKGSMTAPELADRFEVSVRTIYRDIDILSAAGIPVYTAQGKGGGIFIQENYVLNKSFITEQEQNHILMALQGIRFFGQEETNETLAKLSGVFQRQNISWIEIDFSAWHQDHEKIFHVLKSAVFHNKKVTFRYYSAKGEASLRTVEPLKLLFKSRDWYLYAYCPMRKDFRMFKLTRIQELRITSQSFQREAPDKVLEGENQYQEERILLTLVFDRDLAFRVYDYFEDVTVREDGSFLVKASLPCNDQLYRFLLSFGDRAEVLAPEEVRHKMRDKIRIMNQKYET